jgi:hypothetical protein
MHNGDGKCILIEAAVECKGLDSPFIRARTNVVVKQLSLQKKDKRSIKSSAEQSLSK